MELKNGQRWIRKAFDSKAITIFELIDADAPRCLILKDFQNGFHPGDETEGFFYIKNEENQISIKSIFHLSNRIYYAIIPGQEAPEEI